MRISKNRLASSGFDSGPSRPSDSRKNLRDISRQACIWAYFAEPKPLA